MNLSKQKRTLLIIWSGSLFIAIVILGSYLVTQKILLEDFMANIEKVGMICVTYLAAIFFLQFFIGSQMDIRKSIDRDSSPVTWIISIVYNFTVLSILSLGHLLPAEEGRFEQLISLCFTSSLALLALVLVVGVTFAAWETRRRPKSGAVEIRNTEVKMPTVFISHSSQDKEFVERLATDLKGAEVDIWFDRWEIGVGDSIVDKINAGLKESDYVAVVFSRNSVNSRWVQQELNAAYIASLDQQNQMILPILIEDVQVPPLIQDRRYADFRTDYDAGLGALLEVLRQETDTVPTTPRPAQPCALTQMSQAELRRTLNARTSLDEIRTVCFDLEIDYENLRGETKGEKIVELILYVKNRQDLHALVEWLCEERPDLC